MKRKNILKEAGVLLLVTIMITTTFSVTNTHANISFTGGIRDDTTPPVTYCNLTGILERGIWRSDVTVTLTATDNESGVNYTMYKLDEAASWMVYTGPFVVSADGNHVLSYYSVDKAFNMEIPKVKVIPIGHHSRAVKWEQLPDVTENGINICADTSFEPYYPRLLVDDFLCRATSLITNISVWGSWLNNTKGTIRLFHLAFYADIPASQSPTGYSMPGAKLWERNFSQGEFKETLYVDWQQVPKWWWDPYHGYLKSGNPFIYQYDFNIPQDEAFSQNGTYTKPATYWLGLDVNSTNGNFGWITCCPQQHWNDDATYYIPQSPWWNELRYPDQHPLHDQSIDMAFVFNETYLEGTINQLNVGSVKVEVFSPDDVMDTPWNMDIYGRFWYPEPPIVKSGIIPHIAANQTVTISSGLLLGFGPFTLTIRVDGVPLMTAKGFILFFIIFVKSPSYS